MNPRPLIIDLDGTLIHTDMLHESALKALKVRPFSLFHLPIRLLSGKAALKQYLAAHASIDVATLPYHTALITWLKKERAAGRTLILCTASDASIANAIADHVGIFDAVLASDGTRNLAGKQKAEALVERFGSGGFDYAGNSDADLHVWAHAHEAIVVNAAQALLKKAQKISHVAHVFPRAPLGLKGGQALLRTHQWLKNLLLFIPMLGAHDLSRTSLWLSLILAFLSFSLCASTVYIANDLLDLESDRHHPRKRFRPFASGLAPIQTGVIMAPILLVISFGIAYCVNLAFMFWLGVYFIITCAYSFSLKRLLLIDCITLALLYTLRLIAGASVGGHALSFWLLAFSLFLFLSLAFVKRYAELTLQQQNQTEILHGRGYHTDDAPLIQSMGLVSGYIAILVLAMYLNSDTIIRLYAFPQLIWGAVVIMLFWISWVWMQAHRGEMHDDPLVFAVKDRASLAAGALFVIVMVLGAVGVSY